MLNLLKTKIIVITRRIVKRDFSGNTGIAIKNSIFQFFTNVVAKGGSLIFTIILARMLLPENFGLYTLALSTILIFGAFTDLGIGSALIRYLSKYGRNPKKAGAYVFFIRNLKIKLTLLVSFVLVLSSYFIANFYYKKPIFLALLAGSFYVIFNSLLGFVIGLFQARNNFKYPFYKEIFYQIIRLILVPITIILLLDSSKEIFLFGIFLSLSVCFFLSIFFLYPRIKKYRKNDLSSEEKKEVINFILPLSATALTGIFFGTIDIIMLGRFVESSYLAYYQAAFALLGSVSVLIPFAAAFFPIFAKLPKERLNIALKKSLIITFIFSLAAILGTSVFSSFVVKVAYGKEYLLASSILRIISVLLLIDSFNAIFSNFYVSQSKNKFLAKTLIFSTTLNIILNFFLIKYFLQFSMYHATIGAALATILSRSFLLAILFFKSGISDNRKKSNN
ncbi:MAG: flippase [Candidatus Pacearchaeota archaeon]